MSIDTKNTYILILMKPKKKMGLTIHEYALCEIVYHLSNNPDNKQSGWCYASLTSKADMLDLSRRTIIDIQERMIDRGFLEKDDTTKYVRTTKKWYDNVIIDASAETAPVVQKMPQVVQKMHQSGAENALNIYNNSNKDKDLAVKKQTAPSVRTLVMNKYKSDYVAWFGVEPVVTKADVFALERCIKAYGQKEVELTIKPYFENFYKDAFREKLMFNLVCFEKVMAKYMFEQKRKDKAGVR